MNAGTTRLALTGWERLEDANGRRRFFCSRRYTGDPVSQILGLLPDVNLRP